MNIIYRRFAGHTPKHVDRKAFRLSGSHPRSKTEKQIGELTIFCLFILLSRLLVEICAVLSQSKETITPF